MGPRNNRGEGKKVEPEGESNKSIKNRGRIRGGVTGYAGEEAAEEEYAGSTHVGRKASLGVGKVRKR